MSEISATWEVFCQTVDRAGQLTEQQKERIEQIKEDFIARLPSFRPEIKNPKVLSMGYEERCGLKAAHFIEYELADGNSNGDQSGRYVRIDIDDDPCRCQPEENFIAAVLDVIMPGWDLINESFGTVFFFFSTKHLSIRHTTMTSFSIGV